MIDRATAERAIALLRTRADVEYFFDRIDSPDWIHPLKDAGFFDHPEPTERKGDLLRIPSWPQSRFLARIADRAPEAVMDVIAAIPDTVNPRILEDYITACLAMPPAVAARIVPKVEHWSPEARSLFFPERLGALALHLVGGGEDCAALRVLRKLFDPAPDGSDASDWEYGEALTKVLDGVPATFCMQLLSLLCEVLSRHLDRGEEGQKPWDYSFIWRPAIEDHGQNLRGGRRDHLVRGIRDLAELIVTREPQKLESVVGCLEGQGWVVFDRLALHTLRQAGLDAGDLAKSRLVDPAVGGNAQLHHEYGLLLRDWFHRLDESQQEAILERVAEGLELDQWRERFAQNTGHEPTKEDEVRRTAYYYVQQLTLIADALPEEWKTRFDVWHALVGPAEHPGFLSYHSSVWVGPTSPLTEDEIRAKKVPEIVAFLRAWDPPKAPREPSGEGLGRTLAGVVQEDPARFASAAVEFTGLDPTYVRSVLSGLTQATRAGTAFPWEEVLALCAWVVNQPRDAAERTDREYVDLDPGWGWTRTEIGRLLSEGLETKTSARIPFGLREGVWQILAVLTDDPDPDSEEEKAEGSDAVTASINSTRGVAMNAVVRYVLWVWGHTKDQGAWNLDKVPEARQTLERHLDPAIDPAPAVRAVYGFWLPNLVALDRGWVQNHLTEIFPKGATGARLWDAVWAAYISFGHPYNNVLDVLVDEYREAVTKLGPSDAKPTSLVDSAVRLAQHLMAFYWRGKLSRESEDGLITLFFSRASDAVRSEALDFVGRSLRDEETEVPSEVLDRLKELFEWRLSDAEANRGSSRQEELASFGGWYASGRFDPEWAIEQLLGALRISRKAEPDHWVIEQLQKDHARFPLKVVQCLDLLVDGDEEGWRVLHWRDEIRTIVRSTLGDNDLAARTAAEDLVHKLGARGYFDFRDLLSPPSS